MIKNEKGITLAVLAITIIVMTILATVVTYSALDSLRTAQKNAFISEMEMVQAKVNVIYEKMQNNTQDIEYYNSLGQDVSVLGEETLIKILGDSSRDGFKYFSKEDLKNLELEDINQEVIINFSTREVISTRGIKIGGVMYYKLSNIPNYKGHNIDYINKMCYNETIKEKLNIWVKILKATNLEEIEKRSYYMGEIGKNLVNEVERLSNDEHIIGLYDGELHERKVRASILSFERQKAKEVIAKNMISNNLDIDLISKITGLSVENIKELVKYQNLTKGKK